MSQGINMIQGRCAQFRVPRWSEKDIRCSLQPASEYAPLTLLCLA